MIFGPFGILIPGKTYFADAVDLDATDELTLDAANLANVTTNKTGILSAWVKPNSSDISGHPHSGTILTSSAGLAFSFSSTSTTQFRFAITGVNLSSVTILNIRSNSVDVGIWYHVLASWDLAADVSHLYVNGVANQVVTTRTNDTLNWVDATNWDIGDVGGSPATIGGLFDFYLNTEAYIDLSVAANRYKFISEYGNPVDLGSDGSTPTSSQPTLFFHLNDGQAAVNFVTNKGNGGSWSVAAGSLTTASTSPTDG